METIPNTMLPVMKMALSQTAKVLLFYPDFGAQGGIERYILNVSQMLHQRGKYQPVVVCTHNTPFYNQLKSAGIKTYGITTLPVFANPSLRWLDGFTLSQLLWILIKEQPDLVHVHIGHLENLMFKLLGLPLIYTFHGYGSLYSLRVNQNKLRLKVKQGLRDLFRYQCGFLDSLVFVSQAEYIRMLDEGYLPHDAKARVLPNGVPVEDIQQLQYQISPNEIRQSLGIPKDAYCITFINRLDENKNPFLFLRLFDTLAQDPALQPLHCVIAGSGPLSGPLKEVIDKHPRAANIHFLGYYHPVIELLACSDLVIHVPTMEGFGLGVLEAMATGTLCLAHDTGGIGELLESFKADQLLVPVGDFQALVRQAAHLLKLPIESKRQIRLKLKEHALQYDNGVFIEQLEEVYAHVLRP